MRRRQFLAFGLGAGLVRAQQPSRDTVTATATQDKTPRVGIVLSSFQGSQDHDGTPIPGLADPRPRSADLTAAQVEATVRRAIEIGDTRHGDLRRAIASDEWVAIKVDLGSWPGAPGYVRGSATDPRMVGGLLSWLAEKKAGGQFTIADRAPAAAWDASFDGLSYRQMTADLARRYPGVRFEIHGFGSADIMDTPLPRTPARSYRIPSLVQQADRFISVAPLKHLSPTMANYVSLAQGIDRVSDDGLLDLFSYHPADYAIVGGCWWVKDGVAARANLVLAGFSALAVDAVNAALRGSKPDSIPLMKAGWKRGFGVYDLDAIWTRGNEIEEARLYKSPPGVLG
jgi:hypothetical protein